MSLAQQASWNNPNRPSFRDTLLGTPAPGPSERARAPVSHSYNSVASQWDKQQQESWNSHAEESWNSRPQVGPGKGSGGRGKADQNRLARRSDAWFKWDASCATVKGSAVRLELSNYKLQDDDLAVAMQGLDELLQYHLDEGSIRQCDLDIDLSRNLGITDYGITNELVPFLQKWPRCRRLKLYTTSIGDLALSALSRWASGGFAHELHLSDLRGYVTDGGIARFLEEVCCEGRYPYESRLRSYSSLWVRLENNRLEHTADIVAKGVAQGLRLRVVEKNDLHAIRPHTPGTWEETPSVHLVLFHNQGTENSKRRTDYGAEKGGYSSRGMDYGARDGGDSWGKGGGKYSHQQQDWDEPHWSASLGGSQQAASQQWDESYSGQSWGKGGRYSNSLDWEAEYSAQTSAPRVEKQSDQSSWSSNSFPVPKRGATKLNYAQWELKDDDLISQDFRRLAVAAKRNELDKIQEFDLSRNAFQGAGLHGLVELCVNLHKLECIKLFKCRIGDVGASSIAELCWRCPNLNQLHLSHNGITAKGADKIVQAACGSRDGEQQERSDGPPMWLRLEYNKIEGAKDLFSSWASSGLSVCHVPKGCSSSYCQCKMQVHIPFFQSQQGERGERAAASEAFDGERPERPNGEKGKGEKGKGEKGGKGKKSNADEGAGDNSATDEATDEATFSSSWPKQSKWVPKHAAAETEAVAEGTEEVGEAEAAAEAPEEQDEPDYEEKAAAEEDEEASTEAAKDIGSNNTGGRAGPELARKLADRASKNLDGGEQSWESSPKDRGDDDADNGDGDAGKRRKARGRRGGDDGDDTVFDEGAELSEGSQD